MTRTIAPQPNPSPKRNAVILGILLAAVAVFMYAAAMIKVANVGF